MNRRQFLLASSATFAAAAWLRPLRAESQTTRNDATREELNRRFQLILTGFLRNARATGPDYAVCDFPGGRKIASCCTPGGKTYTSVARMLPAMAEYVVARQPGLPGEPDLSGVLRSIFRTAFDPRHVDYWGEPVGKKPTQRTVESSLVAIALARLGNDFVRQLSSAERANINRWLASCTVVPERTNNHAWFTAVNQAARLRLSRTFPEFKGDEDWMLEDLKAMDVLAANAADGWYSDDPKLKVYDYYNFWTFGNFPLFWSRIAGELYPEWNARLRARGREFLQHAPYFFDASGAVPLFGRSLIYRWALLSPLLLGYEQGIWPHSPGLLRRIVRQNYAWWWNLGAFDAAAGKLRETLSPEGTPAVTENYVDNGHPYWAMQGFTFFSLPDTDPFWTTPEEELPVERADFTIRLAGPRMILTGTKSSGQVRWLQATNEPRRDYYRDKYNKFTWSSSFAFNVLNEADFAPWDETLVLRDPATGKCAARVFPDDGELLDDGVRTRWSASLRGWKAKVVSTIRLAGDFEFRRHAIVFEPAADAAAASPGNIELCEGSHAVGLAAGEVPEHQAQPNWATLRSARSGQLVAASAAAGHDTARVDETFDPQKQSRTNLIHARCAVLSLASLIDPARQRTIELVSLFYASPRPAAPEEIRAQAVRLLQRWQQA